MGTPALYALEQLQATMAAALNADPMIDGSQSANGQPIPIVTEDIGDLPTEIDITISKMGLCVVILTPEFKFTNNLAPSLDGWAWITVDVFESVTINRGASGTQIRSSALAQRILAIMHHRPLTGTVPDENNPSKFIATADPYVMQNVAPLLNYRVAFQVHLVLSTPQP